MSERRVMAKIVRLFDRLSPDSQRFLAAHLSRPPERRPPLPG